MCFIQTGAKVAPCAYNQSRFEKILRQIDNHLACFCFLSVWHEFPIFERTHAQNTVEALSLVNFSSS